MAPDLNLPAPADALRANAKRHLEDSQHLAKGSRWAGAVVSAINALEQAAEWYWREYPSVGDGPERRDGVGSHQQRANLIRVAETLSEASATAAHTIATLPGGLSVLGHPAGPPLKYANERIAWYQHLLAADPDAAQEARQKIAHERCGLTYDWIADMPKVRERAIYVDKEPKEIAFALAPTGPAGFDEATAQPWLRLADRLLRKIGVID